MNKNSASHSYRRTKGTSLGATSLAHFPRSNGANKNAMPAEHEHAHLSTAFLADRGCLSSEKVRKHSAA